MGSFTRAREQAGGDKASPERLAVDYGLYVSAFVRGELASIRAQRSSRPTRRAFRRAGLLRVFDLDELFDATETLGRVKPFPGKRLAILTNSGGVGVLAVDRLVDLGGVLAEISPQTRAWLDSVLPPT
jgi:acyl-CoA synthetase (NDP forming)